MSELNKVPASKFENELLANERTFLAWLRTSIAVMSLGFVVARFGLWLRELATQINAHGSLQRTGLSLPLGEGMIAFGALLTLLAAWRYHVVNRAIERGEIKSDPRMVSLVTIVVVLSAIALIIYMVLSQPGS
jgi:inner membrane protein YidH